MEREISPRVNLELYKLDQYQLYQYVRGFLKAKDIPYVEIEGNLVSIRFENKPVFVAHLDTVREEDLKKELFFDVADNILYRIDGILGADDRAGVNLILNHIEHINFILTRDEEIGRVGAKALKVTDEFLNIVNRFNPSCFLELDRRNGKDIIGYDHGYCDYDLLDALLEVLPDSVDVTGVYTDIDEFIHLAPGANLSIGYRNAHRDGEHLIIDEYLYIDSKIEELSKISGKFNLGRKVL